MSWQLILAFFICIHTCIDLSKRNFPLWIYTRHVLCLSSSGLIHVLLTAESTVLRVQLTVHAAGNIRIRPGRVQLRKINPSISEDSPIVDTNGKSGIEMTPTTGGMHSFPMPHKLYNWLALRSQIRSLEVISDATDVVRATPFKTLEYSYSCVREVVLRTASH